MSASAAELPRTQIDEYLNDTQRRFLGLVRAKAGVSFQDKRDPQASAYPSSRSYTWREAETTYDVTGDLLIDKLRFTRRLDCVDGNWLTTRTIVDCESDVSRFELSLWTGIDDEPFGGAFRDGQTFGSILGESGIDEQGDEFATKFMDKIELLEQTGRIAISSGATT